MHSHTLLSPNSGNPVCLVQEVWQLLQEFQALISSYIMKFAPPDAQEWRSVIQEITNFLHADVAMPAPRSPAAAVPFRLSLRASPLQAELKVAPHRQLLHDAVLVSYYPRQVRGSEGGRRDIWWWCERAL